MNDSNSDLSREKPAAAGVQDNFSHMPAISPHDHAEERRLHLQAFDYWHTLKAEREYPLFSELRAEDLIPFKGSSLLLEFNQNGTVVRFLGDQVSELVDAPLEVGNYLAEFPDSDFARALLDQFSHESARAQAAEFEFFENHLSCRGMILPFSRDGSGPHFVMLVASFRRHEPDTTPAEDLAQDSAQDEVSTGQAPAEESTSATMGALNGLLSAGQRAADSIVHMDNGNRSSLYGALASALTLFEGAQLNPEDYNAMLSEHGVRAQARAPYTPVLKLVFGASYDKTRLTEYAAALSYAVRMGQTSAELAEFLKAVPGGIKGCVQQERAYKRGAEGTHAHARQVESEDTLRAMPAVNLSDLESDEEFCMVLARRKKGGGIEALGRTDLSKTALDAAVRHMASQQKPK